MEGFHASVALAVAFCSCMGFAQQPASRIKGRVVDVLNDPLKGVTVTAVDVASKKLLKAVDTDDDGAFLISVENAAMYELRFETPGFSRYARTVGVTKNGDVDVGTVVMEVAPIEEPINIPTVLSELPTSLEIAGRSEFPEQYASTDKEHNLAESRSEVIGVCESLRQLKSLNGHMVSLRGEFHFTSRHGGWLLDEQEKKRPCHHMPKESRIWLSAIWLDSANDPLEDGPVSFREERPTLDDLIKRQQSVKETSDGQILVVTIIGQLRTKKDLRIVHAPDGRGGTMGNGYGIAGAYPALLIVKTVRDVQVH